MSALACFGRVICGATMIGWTIQAAEMSFSAKPCTPVGGESKRLPKPVRDVYAFSLEAGF